MERNVYDGFGLSTVEDDTAHDSWSACTSAVHSPARWYR
jgi:hypothetical protein